jgi:hypothetical protein
MPPQTEDAKARYIRRLGLVTDESRPHVVRLAAVRSIQRMLPPGHPFRNETADGLLDRMKQPWETRVHLVNGRGVKGRVQRPPMSLADVWS